MKKPPEPIPPSGDEYVDGILELLQTKQTSLRHDSALRMLRAHVAEMVEAVKRGQVAQALLDEAAGTEDLLSAARLKAVEQVVEEQKARRLAEIEAARAVRDATATSFQLEPADALRLADALADVGIRKGNVLVSEIQRALVEAQCRGEATAAEKIEKLEEQITELGGEDVGTLEALHAGAQCAGAILSIVGIVSREGEPRPCAEVRRFAEDALRADHGGYGGGYFWGPVEEWTQRWVRG